MNRSGIRIPNWSTTPVLDGRVVAAAAAVYVAVVLVVARISPPAFVVLALLGLLLVAYAAHRWPLSTLVTAAIATLTDPVVTPRLMPSGLDLGPIGASEPMLAVAGVVIAFDALRARTFGAALKDPVLALTLLFVALAIVSAIWNATPPLVAALGIFMTVDAIAIYFLARMVPYDPRAAVVAIGALVAAGVVVALFGIAQVIFDPNPFGFASFEGRFGEGGRITSFVGNPNMVAAVIGLVMPFALYGGRHLPRPRWRWVSRAALFVLMVGLLLTFSRGAWVAVGLAVVIGALLVDRRSLVLLLLTVVLAWGAASVMPRGLPLPGGTESAGEPPAAPVAPDVIDSTVGRFENLLGQKDLRMRFIRDGLPIIYDHMLLGVGPGRYGGAAAAIIPTPVYDEYDTGLFRFRTVHNFWLHLLGESGALGTAVFLTIVVGLLVRFVRAARGAGGLRLVVLAGATTTLLVATLNSLTEMIFEGNMPVILAWLVFGLASTLAPATALFRRSPPSG